MAIENEVKLCVESFDDIKVKLSEMKAKHLITVYEKNVLYDTDASDLKEEDVGLRIRCETGQDGSLKRVILTLKGPRMDGLTKKRLEFELFVSTFDEAHELMIAIGFHKVLVYEKVREKWSCGGTEICLDTLPFGSYIEIEGAGDDIVDVAGKLGFEKDMFLSSNYFDIAKRKGVLGDILFDSG